MASTATKSSRFKPAPESKAPEPTKAPDAPEAKPAEAANHGTRPAKAAPPKAPTLNLDALTVTDEPMPSASRERRHKDNPFVPWLKASHDADKTGKAGKSITTPNANVKEIEYMIRQAANDLGIGARIVKNAADAEHTKVIFAGKDRKARAKKTDTPAPTEATTPAPTDATTTPDEAAKVEVAS